MRVRFAVAAALFALSATAFTSAPTGAAEPTGTVNCEIEVRPGIFLVLPFPFNSGPELGQAVLACVNQGGRVVGVQLGEG